FPGKRGEAFAFRMRRPWDPHRIGLNWVYVDPGTGRVLRVDRFDQQPLGVKLMRLMIPLHYGTIGGLTTRVLWTFAGLMPGVLFVTAVLLWWNRSLARNWRRGFAPSARPARGPAAAREGRPTNLLLALLACAATITLCRAQTSATATLVGNVLDRSGA